MNNNIKTDETHSSNNFNSFKFQLTDNKELRVFGTPSKPWFIAKDIAEFLGYKDTKKAIQDHVDEEDKISFENFRNLMVPGEDYPLNSNLQPQTILINLNGVKTLITYGKKYNHDLMLWLENNFDIKTTVIKRLCKEVEYISYIKQVFSIELMIEQYSVDNYRIDLFFPEYNIAVECDENGHKDRDILNETQRQEYIIFKIGCIFVRFNPDEKNFNIFNTISKIYKIIKDISINDRTKSNLKNKDLLYKYELLEEDKLDEENKELNGDRLVEENKELHHQLEILRYQQETENLKKDKEIYELKHNTEMLQKDMEIIQLKNIISYKKKKSTIIIPSQQVQQDIPMVIQSLPQMQPNIIIPVQQDIPMVIQSLPQMQPNIIISSQQVQNVQPVNEVQNLRTCVTCGIKKDILEYHKRNDGYANNVCKKCVLINQAKRRKEAKEVKDNLNRSSS